MLCIYKRTFTNITQDELADEGGLNLITHNVLTDARRATPSVRLPASAPRTPPTKHLRKQLARLERVWSRNSETGRRAFIDAILAEAVDVANFGPIVDERDTSDEEGVTEEGERKEEEEESGMAEPASTSLQVFTELEMNFVGKTMTVKGTIDYLLAHVAENTVEGPDKDSNLVVVETKREWPEKSFVQALAEGEIYYSCAKHLELTGSFHSKGGVLLRKRQGSSSPSGTSRGGPVFVVLTNCLLWIFFVIDNQGVVYCSGLPVNSLTEILTWITWFIRISSASLPRISCPDLTKDDKQIVTNELAASCTKLWLKKKMWWTERTG